MNNILRRKKKEEEKKQTNPQFLFEDKILKTIRLMDTISCLSIMIIYMKSSRPKCMDRKLRDSSEELNGLHGMNEKREEERRIEEMIG